MELVAGAENWAGQQGVDQLTASRGYFARVHIVASHLDNLDDVRRSRMFAADLGVADPIGVGSRV